jgi:porin
VFLKRTILLALGLLMFPPAALADYGLTGDWYGNRDWLADHGISLDLSGTQFYQGVAAGGREQEWDYGGKFDYWLNLEGGKLGLNEGFFVDMHAETRIGESVNDHDGLLAPANIAMSFPDSDRHVTAITGLKLTQALSESVAVYAGKINTLDEYALRYAGGPGLGGFMNTSLVFNPIVARTVPYSAAGVGCAFLSDKQPWLTLTVFDPEERATKGLEDLYERGVTVVPEIVLRADPWGLPGIYNFGGTYSNADYTSIDPSAWLQLPLLGGGFPVENESWSLYSNFFQSVWVDRCDASRQWGFFGQFGLSDGNPNPIHYTAICGVGGRSMARNRPLDRFGIGYYYLGLSDQFKTLSIPVLRQRDEYGVEMFYNYAISPAIWLTGDLQIARPSTVGLDRVIIPGVRLQMLF